MKKSFQKNSDKFLIGLGKISLILVPLLLIFLFITYSSEPVKDEDSNISISIDELAIEELETLGYDISLLTSENKSFLDLKSLKFLKPFVCTTDKSNCYDKIDKIAKNMGSGPRIDCYRENSICYKNKETIILNTRPYESMNTLKDEIFSILSTFYLYYPNAYTYNIKFRGEQEVCYYTLLGSTYRNYVENNSAQLPVLGEISTYEGCYDY